MSYIYQIKNNANGKIYIGSSKNYKKRWKQHIAELNSNSHYNKYLQNAWNKYGEDNFKFTILEEVDLSDQFIKEQEYLNKYKPFDDNGYNIVRQIDGALNCDIPITKFCEYCGFQYDTYSHLSKYCDECSEELKQEETDRYFNGDDSMNSFYSACGGAAEAMGGWDNFWDDLLG